MSNEIAFESILRSADQLVITDVRQEENMTFFKINGHQFQTFGDKIYHKDSIFYNASFTKFLARQTHDPEGIEEKEKRNKEVTEDVNLWSKHKLAIYKIVFIRAAEILVMAGDEQFEKYVDQHFFITPEDIVKKLYKKLEKS